MLGLRCCIGVSAAAVAGAALRRSVHSSHFGGFVRCGARALDTGARGAQAQELRFEGLGAPQHVESSWRRDRTRVLCVIRQSLIHCTTREVQLGGFLRLISP